MFSNCPAKSDAVFQSCKTCPSGECASTPCSATADAVCSACATCNPYECVMQNAEGVDIAEYPQTYAAVQCGGTQNTVCEPCSFENPPGMYQTALCTTSTNTQYTNCTPGPCPEGQWRVPCYQNQDSPRTALARRLASTSRRTARRLRIRSACTATPITFALLASTTRPRIIVTVGVLTLVCQLHDILRFRLLHLIPL